MKICLFYNENAGEGVSLAQLRHEIQGGGHELVQVVDKESELQELHPTVELVVAAGGDGTICRAALGLAEVAKAIPLAVLPLGTANNVATSLGLDAPIPELVARWSRAKRVPLDIASVGGGWGETRFVEGTGGGLIPGGITAMSTRSPAAPGKGIESKLDQAVRQFHKVLSRLRPRRCALRIDDERVESEYLLVEVLNIQSVGPNLFLSGEADPGDGLLTLVVADESHRDEIDAYLQKRMEGRKGHLSLPTWHARRIEMEGWNEIHVDANIQNGIGGGRVTIRIEPSALSFLS